MIYMKYFNIGSWHFSFLRCYRIHIVLLFAQRFHLPHVRYCAKMLVMWERTRWSILVQSRDVDKYKYTIEYAYNQILMVRLIKKIK